MKLIFPALLAIALAGCATVPPPSTASGKLEMMLNNVRVDCARSELANTLVNGGYSIKSNSEYQIVAGRITNNAFAAAMLGTSAGGAPEERVTLTLIPQSDSDALRVIFDGGYISNPGTAFESVQPVGASQATQDQLTNGEYAIESKCAKSTS